MPNYEPAPVNPKVPLLTELVEKILSYFLAHGEGVHAKINTANTPYVQGQDFIVLKNVNRILPAFTLYNAGATTILYGWGNAEVPLPSGGAVTCRWKNPSAKGGFVANDNGTATTVYVVS